ncbi:MAG: DUF4440 domain-containing protein [Gammaproteobacteria bacterium]
MNIRSSAFTAIVLTAAAASASADISTCAADPASRAIAEAHLARWQAAVESGDTAAIARLYEESAVLMPPSDETLVGRAPIAEYLASHVTPAHQPSYQVDLVSCELHGNALHIAGVWGLPSTPAATWTSGNLMQVIEASGEGEWRASYEIWN